MAENTQTFILVGDFKDNITPSLRKLDREIGNLTRSFTKMQAKLRPISRDLAVMAESATRISTAFKGQRTSVESSVRALREYRKEAGKAKAANEQLARSARGVRGSTPKGGAGGGGGGGGGASMAGGFVAGQGLANMTTGAIVRGFRIGTNIMLKPFQYGADAIGERIQDEMSDIKSAGGMFAVDRRENMGIFKTLADARNFQEELNAKLSQSAAALPGETAEYVQQAKQLTDTVMLSLAKNKDEFIKFAQELDPAVKSSTDAMGTVLQQFTEKAVLLGQGEGSGIYGVPQILEMLVSQEKVNINAFNRFGAYMRNPLLKNALQNAEKELQKTGANTAERFRVIQKVLNEAVPNEVVMDMTNSAEGIIQAIKSGFLDPESGLLGLGRKLDIALPKVDSLGRYVDEHGKVVDDVNKAMKQDASLFEVLKQTIGGFVLPLTGIMDILPEIYEPLSGLAKGLIDIRNVAQEFYAAFNGYTKFYENEAKKLSDQAAALMDQGRNAEAAVLNKRSMAIAKRAKLGGTLNALNDLLSAFGAIDESKYKANAQKLMDITSIDPGAMVKEMLDQLMGSKFMETLGEAIGAFVGTVIKSVGDLMANANDLTQTGGFAAGLRKGFQGAKGPQGISMIFKNLFSIIGKALMGLFKSAPFEMSVLAALTVGMPILQGAITAGITQIFSAVAAKVGTMGLTGGIGGVGATISGWLGAVVPALSMVARFLPPVAAAMAGIVFLGGGVENTLRQLKQIFGEIGHSLWGSFSGLSDVIGTLLAFISDLGNGIGRLINYLAGANNQLDLLKILLFPITGALQALEIGLLGLNVVLTKVRSWMANWLGTEEEKKAAYQASVEADVKMRQSQGRQNAYNASMLGPEEVKKQINNALYELSHSKELKASRSAELKAFVAEAKQQLSATKSNTPKPGTPSAPSPGVAPAPAISPPAVIKPETLKPIQDSITTASAGTTTATNNVKAATYGVKAATEAAKTEATKQAVTQQRKTDLLLAGINNVKSALMTISSKVATESSLKQIATNTAKTNEMLAGGKVKVQFDLVGGPKGGTPGAVDAFTPMATTKFGLQVTSGYRPGDPGYHGVNRARDYSNGSGPTPQMMNFARFMASAYGSQLSELIYTPLGFSIKNGKQVPPYAQAAHYNHVHVALANGLDMPRLFTSAAAAANYESMMAPAGARVATVTANSSEFGGGAPMTLNQTVNVNGSSDPQATAEAVWRLTAQAVQQLQANNFGG